VLNAGVAVRLVELLGNASATVQTPALRTIGNIVTGKLTFAMLCYAFIFVFMFVFMLVFVFMFMLVFVFVFMFVFV
jgi:hypothetical protein